MKEGEIAAAGDVGLGAGASAAEAAEATEMTATKTDIAARSITLVEAISVNIQLMALKFSRVLGFGVIQIGIELNN